MPNRRRRATACWSRWPPRASTCNASRSTCRAACRSPPWPSPMPAGCATRRCRACPRGPKARPPRCCAAPRLHCPSGWSGACWACPRRSGCSAGRPRPKPGWTNGARSVITRWPRGCAACAARRAPSPCPAGRCRCSRPASPACVRWPLRWPPTPISPSSRCGKASPPKPGHGRGTAAAWMPARASACGNASVRAWPIWCSSRSAAASPAAR